MRRRAGLRRWAANWLLFSLSSLAACTSSPGAGDGAVTDAGGTLDAGEGGGPVDAAGGEAATGLDTIPLAEGSVLGDGRVCGCGPVEVCDDDFDNNCNGEVNERCPCLPGTTRRCLRGVPHSSAPLCAYGEQRCEGSGEFGVWGECSAAGPRADAGSTAYGCRRIVVIGAPGANPSANFQAWLERNGAIVQRVQTTAGDGLLRRALLDTFDVAIIDWLQRDYTEEESNTLRDWVRAGGGLIALSGHDSGQTAARHVSLLRSVGITYELGEAYDGPATMLASPLSTLPGTDRVLGPVSFYGGLRVLRTPAFEGSVIDVATVMYGGGRPIVVGIAGDTQRPDGPLGGRVFVFGDEWIEFDSEWATMPDITQLWFNAVNWVSPGVASRSNDCE